MSNCLPVSAENSRKANPCFKEKLIEYQVASSAPQRSKGFRKNRPASVNHMTKVQTGNSLFSCTVWCRQCLPKFNSYTYYLISQRVWLDVCHTCWRKTAKLPSCSQNLTSIRYWCRYPTLTEAKKQMTG